MIRRTVEGATPTGPSPIATSTDTTVVVVMITSADLRLHFQLVRDAVTVSHEAVMVWCAA